MTSDHQESSAPGVDIHAHLVPKSLLDDLSAGRLSFPSVDVRSHESTHVVSFNGGTPTRPIAPGLTDPGARTRWMDQNGIGRQVVGGWLDIFGYELAADEGAEWAQLLNERILEATADDDRLSCLGTVPLQDPERAAQTIREQRAAGLPGVMVATRAGSTELDDPALTPFWEAADETGAVVFIHPGFGGASERYADFGLVNGLARLEDSTVTLARLLYCGIPAKHPGARIVTAHGGAALPYVMGRLVRNHLNHPGTADPLESFTHLYFDSVVFDPTALGFLVSMAGAGHVLLGSDYPFPIGDLSPRAVVDAAGLLEEERAAILGGTAHRLLFGEDLP
jgi:aminocarboxymuconate-semialdehyde decarboxylase